MVIKRLIVLVILSVFVSGVMAGAAMANCGHAKAGGHASMIKAGVMGDNAQAGDMAYHEDHSAPSHMPSHMDEHSCHDTGSKPAGHSDGDSVPSTCHNCAGSVCQSPTIAPEPVGLDHHRSTDSLYSEEDIHIHAITLAVIPDPPKQLS